MKRTSINCHSQPGLQFVFGDAVLGQRAAVGGLVAIAGFLFLQRRVGLGRGGRRILAGFQFVAHQRLVHHALRGLALIGGD